MVISTDQITLYQIRNFKRELTQKESSQDVTRVRTVLDRKKLTDH